MLRLKKLGLKKMKGNRDIRAKQESEESKRMRPREEECDRETDKGEGGVRLDDRKGQFHFESRNVFHGSEIPLAMGSGFRAFSFGSRFIRSFNPPPRD